MFNKMDFENYETAIVVSFKGDIDHFCVSSYKEKLNSTIERYHFKHVIMDFKEVTFIDSAGIGFILGRYNQVKDYGGKLLVCGINEYCDRVFKIAGLWKIVDRYDNLNIAKQEAGVM